MILSQVNFKQNLTNSFVSALTDAKKKVDSWNYNLSDKEKRREIQEIMCDETDRLVAQFGGINDDIMWKILDDLNNTHFDTKH